MAHGLIFLSHRDAERLKTNRRPMGWVDEVFSMVTNYPQQLTAATEVAGATNTTNVIARALVRANQLFCGFRGHDSVLHFAGNRVMMHCTSCGHDSPGWEINGRAPRRRYEGDARRHLMASRRLVFRKTA